jgi:hypothetical protein
VPKGAAVLGIAWRDIDSKYRALLPASGLSDEAIDASLGVLHDFRRVPNASVLTGLLRVEPRAARAGHC